jgi:hypothetical protein
MGALLINDLRYPGSVANPKNLLSHPLLLFAGTGFHGGLWRCGFNITSIGLWAALIHYFRVYIFSLLSHQYFSLILSYLFPRNTNLKYLDF